MAHIYALGVLVTFGFGMCKTAEELLWSLAHLSSRR